LSDFLIDEQEKSMPSSSRKKRVSPSIHAIPEDYVYNSEALLLPDIIDTGTPTSTSSPPFQPRMSPVPFSVTLTQPSSYSSSPIMSSSSSIVLPNTAFKQEEAEPLTPTNTVPPSPTSILSMLHELADRKSTST